MAKRGPQSELTDRNWDDEDEPEECGVFKQASSDTMQQRVIKKAKRRGGGDDSSKAFGGFGGFMKTSSSTPFSAQNNSGTATTFKPSVSFNSTQSVFAGASSSMENSSTSSKSELKDNSSYLHALKSLNESVLSWIKQHVEKNPYIILTPIFKDYEKYHESLEAKKSTSNGSSSISSNGSTKTEAKSTFGSVAFSKPESKETKPKDDNAKDADKPFGFGPSPSNGSGFKFSTTPASISTASSGFTFGKTSTASTSSGSGFGFFSSNNSSVTTTTTASSGFSFGSSPLSSSTTATPATGASGFSFGSSPLSSSTTATPATGASGFSFGALAAKAMSENTQKSNTENKDGDDDEYVPPKPEVKEIQEEGSLFSKRCKMFYQNEGQWKERGVGNVHVKPLDGNKTQLLVRADTNLGNILLNINVTVALPVSRQGKNNVLLVCVPNPPLKEGKDKESDPKPISMLIRVKTGEEADELLAKLEERKALLS